MEHLSGTEIVNLATYGIESMRAVEHYNSCTECRQKVEDASDGIAEHLRSLDTQWTIAVENG